jgi:hypothetical protein
MRYIRRREAQRATDKLAGMVVRVDDTDGPPHRLVDVHLTVRHTLNIHHLAVAAAHRRVPEVLARVLRSTTNERHHLSPRISTRRDAAATHEMVLH